MKGTPVKSTKILTAGFAPFEETIPVGTAGTIINAGKTFQGTIIWVKFDGFGPRVACKREEIEATG